MDPYPPRGTRHALRIGADGKFEGIDIVEDTFFVLSLDRSLEFAVWWGPNDSCYTHDIDQAGRYTGAQIAEKPSHYNDGTKNRAVRRSEVLRLIQHVVLAEKVR